MNWRLDKKNLKVLNGKKENERFGGGNRDNFDNYGGKSNYGQEVDSDEY